MEQLTFWSEEPHAKVSASRENKQDCAELVDLRSPIASFLRQCVPGGSSGKMFRVSLAPTEEKISKRYSERLMKSGILSRCECWTLNTCEWTDSLVPFLKEDGVSSLSDILVETGDIPPRYYLSPDACRGVLRRAESRGQDLPEALRQALEEQSK